MYGEHDAIVFDGVDYFEIWLRLMSGRWGWLADKMVQLPGAPVRSKDEKIAFLQSRVQPVAYRAPVESGATAEPQTA